MKSTFKAVAKPLTYTFPLSLHLSQMTQSMMREML